MKCKRQKCNNTTKKATSGWGYKQYCSKECREGDNIMRIVIRPPDNTYFNKQR